MKYLITESKINSAIYNFIDELFTLADGSTKIIKIIATDNDGSPLDDSFNFINPDYYYNGGGYPLFSWTGIGYYKTAYSHDEITKHEYERLGSESPFVEINDKEAVRSLNGYFGELWKPVFKQWFIDKTGMDYKTLLLY